MDILKYGLLAFGGYILYEYFYGTAAAVGVTPATASLPPLDVTSVKPGGGATGATAAYYANPGIVTDPNNMNQVAVAPVSAQPQVSSTLVGQLQQLAVSSGLPGLNTDQWLYYFGQITGMWASGIQTETMLQTLGLSDGTRGTLVPLGQFLTALHQVGLGRLQFIN